MAAPWRVGAAGALVVVALVVIAPACTAAPAAAMTRQPATALGVPDPVTGLGDVTRGFVGSASRDVASAVFDGIGTWMEKGTAALLGSMIGELDDSTKPDFRETWLNAHYQEMVGVAVLLALPLLLASAITAVVRQDAGPLLRAVFVHLPLAGILTAGAMALVRLALAATDDLCRLVTNTTGSDTNAALSQLRAGLDASVPGSGTFAAVMVCLLICIAALLLTLELIVRTSAVYVAILFMPLAFAGWLWPATARWTRRLVETLAILILSKFVIVAIISMAASAVAEQSDNLSGLLSGGALLLFAAMAPFALLRMVPIVEAGMIGHLEGAGRSVMPSLSSGKPGPLDALRGPGGGPQGGEPRAGAQELGPTDAPRVGQGEDHTQAPVGDGPAPVRIGAGSTAADGAAGGAGTASTVGDAAGGGTAGAGAEVGATGGAAAGATAAGVVALPVAAVAAGVAATRAAADRVKGDAASVAGLTGGSDG